MAKPPPRLYVGPSSLVDTSHLVPEKSAWHYLHTVLRLGDGDTVVLFDGVNGEWRARITDATRRGASLVIENCVGDQKTVPDLKLMFAPLRKDPTEMILQKGTELGVRTFQPVLTERTVRPRGAGKEDRQRQIVIEAAEQSERTDIPAIALPLSLSDALEAAAEENRRVLFCDEAGDDPGARWGGAEGRGTPALDTLLADRPTPATHLSDPWAILIGPEGGFTPQERAMIRAAPGALAVSLGPRILKAETAAIAAITLWQAALGDLI